VAVGCELGRHGWEVTILSAGVAGLGRGEGIAPGLLREFGLRDDTFTPRRVVHEL
jgi:hypothetical protein